MVLVLISPVSISGLKDKLRMAAAPSLGKIGLTGLELICPVMLLNQLQRLKSFSRSTGLLEGSYSDYFKEFIQSCDKLDF